MDVHKLLDIANFEDKEKQIYLHLLSHPGSTLQEISNNLSFVRQTTYDVIKKMLTTGKVQYTLVEKKKRYTATDPEALATSLEEATETFKSFLPLLTNLKSEKDKELSSKIFIGLNSIKKMTLLSLEDTKITKWMYNNENTKPVLQDYFYENYAKKRVERKIPIQILTNRKEKGTAWSSSKKELREVRETSFLKNKKVSIGLSQNRVFIHTLNIDNLVGVVIENKEIFDFYNDLFEYFWNEKISEKKRRGTTPS